MKHDQGGADNRLMALEEKIEYQEYTIEKLNDALIAQQMQLDKLESKIQRLEEKLAAGQLEIGNTDDSVPPPHY